MKQAYLICAHGSFNLLKRLILQLDDDDTDIFIHIDKKAGNINYDDFEKITQHSNVFCLRNRVSVIWGHITQPLTSIMMLETALKHDAYDYFHLISGVDFPIKSNTYIKDFLSQNKGKEFVGFSGWHYTLNYKLQLYHFIPTNLQQRYPILRYTNKGLLKVQKILGVKHFKDTKDFSKGCNWWSITTGLAKDIVRHKEEFRHIYKYTSCSDEIFLQTFINQNAGKYQIFDMHDEYHGCLRHLDWNRGTPYVFTIDDFDELKNSPSLFARKFSEENMDIIDKIEQELL